MVKLNESTNAWGSTRFEAVLKAELHSLPPGSLPLQQGLRSGSVAIEDGIGFSVLGASADAQAIEVRLAVFYAGIVAGCNCADDPTPVEPVPEYCELLLSMDRATGQARVRLADS
jgi:hypothetical protein